METGRGDLRIWEGSLTPRSDVVCCGFSQTCPEPMKSSIATEAHVTMENGRTHATISWSVIRHNPQSVYQKTY